MPSKWKITKSKTLNIDQLLQDAVGRPEDFVLAWENRQPPFDCKAVKADWVLLSVNLDGALRLAQLNKLPDDRELFLELADRLQALCKFKEVYGVTVLIDGFDKIATLTFKHHSKEEFVSSYTGLVFYSKQYDFVPAVRYEDQTWSSFLGSWAMSDLHRLIFWVDDFPRYMTFDSLCEKGLSPAKLSLIKNINKYPEPMKWFFVYTFLDNIPGLDLWSNDRHKTLLLEHMYKYISNYDCYAT